ncbi:NACHT domain-containing protein [Bernardetia sp. OM2101]|uniref:NACHT domain-containing protein n=1 Tax=Bernardetia sp. OM2101 TaxID=3344876 RepID=UPI0035CF8C64
MDLKAEATNLITPFIKLLEEGDAEWKNLIGDDLKEYLRSQTDKYYSTNTFLHRQEKVRFYDIYFPIKATYKSLNTDFSDLDKLFDDYSNITLVGSAGSGKTTLVKYIFLETIKSQSRIPILIELRRLNQYEGNFEKLLLDKIVKLGAKSSNKIVERALKKGKFLFLLDGYDEIYSEKKQEINAQIEDFVDKYSKNKFVITTRQGSGIENFDRFTDFKVCSLSDSDITNFVAKVVNEEERKEAIFNVIKNPQHNNYTEYLRNPLLLSMFILAFESHPEIPEKKSAFYRNVFDTLYSKHDGFTKNSFAREKKTQLTREDFEDILSRFSYLTLKEGKYSFTEEYLTDVLQKINKFSNYNYNTSYLIEDLHTAISILLLDGLEYTFPHRSLQEYFTALFISKLTIKEKKIAYKNSEKVKSIRLYDFNLWYLLKELDKEGFMENILIPKLSKFLLSIKYLSDVEMIKKLWSLLQLQVTLKFEDNKTTLTRSSSAVVEEFMVLRFCNLYTKRLGHRNLTPYFDSAFDEVIELNYDKKQGEYTLKLSDTDNIKGIDRLIKSYLELEAKEDIHNLVANIESKIQSYKQQIESSRKNNMDLLNL